MPDFYNEIVATVPSLETYEIAYKLLLEHIYLGIISTSNILFFFTS